MTTERERYLLTRCLRLELRIEQLEGWPAEQGAPAIELPPLARRIQRIATADEIAQMRALATRGLSPAQIGHRLHFSDTTVRHLTEAKRP